MTRLRNDPVNSYHVVWEGSSNGRRKGRSVRYKPLPTEKTGSLAFGGRGIRYGERFDDWDVFLIIISSRVSVLILVDCRETYTVSP